MTDGVANQIAVIAPSATNPVAQINQLAIIVPSTSVPPVAGGAQVNQLAIVSVSFEYEIVLNYHGWLIRSIQGFPYYIED